MFILAIQYIIRHIHTVCILLCFILVWQKLILSISTRVISNQNCVQMLCDTLHNSFMVEDLCARSGYQGPQLHPTDTVGCNYLSLHYDDVMMGTKASQITSLMIVYSIVYSDADQGKHQSSASLTFVRGIHRGTVNSPHKWSVTRKILPFDDVIMALDTYFWRLNLLNVSWALGINLSMGSANESQRYIVASSHIGWDHRQNDLWTSMVWPLRLSLWQLAGFHYENLRCQWWQIWHHASCQSWHHSFTSCRQDKYIYMY